MAEIETLIDAVRVRPFLYDKRDKQYKEVSRKADAWKEIGITMKQSGATVSKKWKNLRDCYLKYLKVLNGGTGSVMKYQNWPWARHLEFLNDSLAHPPTRSNPPPDQPLEDEVAEKIEDVFEMLPLPQKKRKTEWKDGTEETTAVPNYLKTENDQKTKLDGIDKLFSSYAQTFKTFSPRTQALLKMELAQLFGRAELEEIDRETTSSGSSTSLQWSGVNITSPVTYTEMEATEKAGLTPLKSSTGILEPNCIIKEDPNDLEYNDLPLTSTGADFILPDASKQD